MPNGEEEPTEEPETCEHGQDPDECPYCKMQGMAKEEAKKEVGKRLGKGAKEAGKKGAEAAKKGAQAAGRAAAQLGSRAVAAIAALGPWGWVAIGVIVVCIIVIIILVAVFGVGLSGKGGGSPFDPATEPTITEALALTGDPVKLRQFIKENTDKLIQEITAFQNDAERLRDYPEREELKAVLSDLKTVLEDIKTSLNDAYIKKKLDGAVNLFQALAYFNSIDTNEEEITGECPTPSGSLADIGDGFQLKQEAADQFNRAQETAQSKGLELEIRSAYRSLKRQTELWDKAVKKYGSEEKARKWVARPGACAPHITGGAIDVRIKGKRGDPDGTLLKIMCEAGWVRYKAEWWHFEYKTRRWQNGQNAGACVI